jgi:hypothetical protein
MAIGTKVLTFGGSKVGTVGENKLMGWDIYFQAKNFISVANITDPTQITAINYLVKELVDNNLIGKFNFIYPMVGGDATRHSYNLIDTGLYRLTFNGGWTHSANGALPNGTNAWANTGFIPTNVSGTDNAHISYYSRTNNQNTDEYAIAGSTNVNPIAYLRIRDQGNVAEGGFGNYRVNQPTTVSGGSTDSRGLFMLNVQSNTLRQLLRNKTVLNANTVNQVIGKPNINLYIGAYNFNGVATGFTSKECAFASIGNGMSNVEQALFYDIVQEYQTILGRNV